MKITTPLKNEDGIALIVALMLLVLLTLLGMAATTTSVLEIQIADNDRDYKVNFYKAETAAYEAARAMALVVETGKPGSDLDGDSTVVPWMGKSVQQRNPALIQLDNWTQALTDGDAVQSAYNNNEAAYAAYYYDTENLSMDNTEPDMHLYLVYGRSQDNSAQALVELGVKLTY